MEEKGVALVTGGSRGIGRAIAIRLARDGYQVIINFRNNVAEAEATQKSIEEIGGKVQLCQFDITDRETVSKNIEALVAKYTIDVLVLCAGIHHDELLVFMSENQWDTVISTNLTSFFAITKPIVKQMLLNRSGRIIALSSTSGEAGLPGQVNYSAAKAGLIGAIKALALECAKRNVLVNAITPGYIETEMTLGMDLEKITQKIPLARFGTTEEVAGVVSFLVSPDANYITGQVIRVNGGSYV